MTVGGEVKHILNIEGGGKGGLRDMETRVAPSEERGRWQKELIENTPAKKI